MLYLLLFHVIVVDVALAVQDQANTNKSTQLPPQILEINPSHPIMKQLAQAREGDAAAVAAQVAEQILDNALIAAGLLDDPRGMLPRLTNILRAALKQ